ncbi:MAG: O-methyltransferase [Peptococcia bacterium]
MAEIKIPKNIVNYIRQLIPEQSSFFTEIEEECRRDYIPLIDPEVGQFLRVLLGIKQAERILELGTGIGYSTLWMALNPANEGRNVHITTMEIDPNRYERACRNFQRAEVTEMVTPLLGDANAIIPSLEGSFDFIFMDAAKGQYPEFFQKFWPLLEPGGVLVIDNVLMNGWVADLYWPERRKKTMVVRLRQLLEMLKEHPGLTVVTLPFGDGVTVCVRNKTESPKAQENIRQNQSWGKVGDNNEES